jgi:hypothetical protein
MHLDRDAALALEIHRIEQLRFHLTLRDGTRDFKSRSKASSCRDRYAR